ncbi:MAG: monofunctional biosynthetic peptidoglycan transglycosylase [Candidatus Tectomicrobia bacterium]|jgi:monofunctional biosynthetic peptidoglycan transglycosylase|nr:monofunctional biosynthetic peptidoglycan transglycosylase [Candidatus Tectomicrobia bacterium]
MRRLLLRLGRWLVLLVLLFLLVPIPLVLVLRIIEPPTTMVMVIRTVERVFNGAHPIYPRRQPVPMARISPWLRRAVVAAEDDRFYRHNGFDFQEIARALEAHEQGKPLRGASTISQQTAKNLFLWDGRSYLRKALEAYLTVVLEALLPKERILEIYLNLVEWGDGVFGAEMAAQVSYGKAAALLSREEAAKMAAVLPNPRGWNVAGPLARRRARVILERMSSQGER